MISFIPQDNTLFHGTIRENLLYGKNESVSEERIAYILKELGLSPLVAELEDGLDTQFQKMGQACRKAKTTVQHCKSLTARTSDLFAR